MFCIDTRTDAEREHDRQLQADAVVTVSVTCDPDIHWVDGILTFNCTGLPWEVALRQVLADRADLLEELAVN